jgi:hypothetical protein
MSRESVDARIKTGKDYAYFPPGHVETALWAKSIRFIARHSRRVRAFFFEMRHNRLRTHLVARYYRDILNDMQRGDVGRHLAAISPDAETSWFGIEVWRGPQGAARMIQEWQETFDAPVFEMREFINPPGKHVLCVGEVAGQGAGSGATVTTELFLSSRSRRAWQCESLRSTTVPRPSKPWGCGSRRCRGRTSM